MPVEPLQTIAVSAGAREYVWAVLDELSGQALPGLPELALVLVRQGVPIESDWQAPDASEAVDADTIRAALLVDSTVAGPGWYDLWIRVTDSAEIPVARAAGKVRLI